MSSPSRRRRSTGATAAPDAEHEPDGTTAVLSDHGEPEQDPARDGAGASEPPAPLPRWLPWGLVAALTIACVVLATLYGGARQRVRELEASAAASATATPSAAAISAAPTTGASAQQLLALQRRQAGDPRSLGQTDAPIVLIEWADFRSANAAAWYQQTLPQLVPYIKSGSLRVEYRDLVLFGDESTAAARAARAAGNQGHFWDYSQQLWALSTGSGRPEITDQELQDLASKAGVSDLAQFNTDRNAQATLDAVTSETQQGTQMGLSAAPFFLVNTTQIPGAYPAATFVSVIQQYGGKPAQ